MMRRGKYIASVLLLICIMTQMSAQKTNVGSAMGVEKIFMSLPDSCFKLFVPCVNDSTFFMGKKRYRIIDPKDSSTASIVHLNEEDDSLRKFSMTSDNCTYATTMNFTWWNIASGKTLVIITIDQIDMCTERQMHYSYEFTDGKISAVQSLPAFTVADFASLKTLSDDKINAKTSAPVFVRWNAGSDTLSVSIELAPYSNCPDSYRGSPLIRLKEKQLARNQIYFIRKEDHFVKCASK